MRFISRILAATLLVAGVAVPAAQAQTAATPAKTTAPAKTATPATTAAPAAAPAKKAAAGQSLLDINTATADQLKSVLGIGDADAKRVIDGRPYTGKNQLVTKGIMQQAAYDKVKSQIIAHRVKK